MYLPHCTTGCRFHKKTRKMFNVSHDAVLAIFCLVESTVFTTQNMNSSLARSVVKGIVLPISAVTPLTVMSVPVCVLGCFSLRGCSVSTPIVDN